MVKKFKDLEDKDLRGMDLLDMRKAYVELRDHHIEETTKLYAKLAKLRSENTKMGSLLEDNVYKTFLEALLPISLGQLNPDKILKDALKELVPSSGRSGSSGTNYKCDLTRYTCPGCPVHEG